MFGKAQYFDVFSRLGKKARGNKSVAAVISAAADKERVARTDLLHRLPHFPRKFFPRALH